VIRIEKEDTEFALAELRGFCEFGFGLLTEATPVEVASSMKQVKIRAVTLEKLVFPVRVAKRPFVHFARGKLTEAGHAITGSGAITGRDLKQTDVARTQERTQTSSSLLPPGSTSIVTGSL